MTVYKIPPLETGKSTDENMLDTAASGVALAWDTQNPLLIIGAGLFGMAAGKNAPEIAKLMQLAARYRINGKTKGRY